MNVEITATTTKRIVHSATLSAAALERAAAELVARQQGLHLDERGVSYAVRVHERSGEAAVTIAQEWTE